MRPKIKDKTRQQQLEKVPVSKVAFSWAPCDKVLLFCQKANVRSAHPCIYVYTGSLHPLQQHHLLAWVPLGSLATPSTSQSCLPDMMTSGLLLYLPQLCLTCHKRQIL